MSDGGACVGRGGRPTPIPHAATEVIEALERDLKCAVGEHSPGAWRSCRHCGAAIPEEAAKAATDGLR